MLNHFASHHPTLKGQVQRLGRRNPQVSGTWKWLHGGNGIEGINGYPVILGGARRVVSMKFQEFPTI